MKKLLLLPLLCISASSAQQYNYAPVRKPVQGLMTLACMGIHYENSDEAKAADKAGNVCGQIAQFYRTNSRKLLDYKTANFQVQVPYGYSAANINNAAKFAKNQHPGFDKYAMIVGNALSASHAGGGIAYLKGALYRDAEHECGHLIGLGHSGAYKLGTDGKYTLDPYADGQSVMGSFPSPYIAAPQYYFLGWLKQTEAVVYQPAQTYTLRRIADFNGSGIAVVIVPGSLFFGKQDPNPVVGKDRDAYISYSSTFQQSVSLQLGSEQGAGSQRIKIFGNEYYDSNFTGLHIKVLSKTDSSVTISVDFAAKPQAGYQEEADPAEPTTADDSTSDS